MSSIVLESLLRIHLRHRNSRGTHDIARALIRKTIAALRVARSIQSAPATAHA